MMYSVVTYDKASEQMKGQLIVPPAVLAKVKKIAGFELQHDGLGEYPLDEAQTKKVAKLLGFRAEPERFFLQRRALRTTEGQRLATVGRISEAQSAVFSWRSFDGGEMRCAFPPYACYLITSRR
jgi:hypothetical protein